MPELNPRMDVVANSILGHIDDWLRRSSATDVVRLHQGKTYFTPRAYPVDWSRDQFDILAHEHAPPQGSHQLRRRLAEAVSERRGRPVAAHDIVITCGATHAIAAVLRCILVPGSEVLVLSPQWLFARGLIDSAGGTTIEVPVFLELESDSSFDFIGALEQSVGPRTRAIYFNTPNNPTGYSLDAAALTELVAFAEQHDLWIIADNAYEEFDFSPGGFVEIGSLPGAARRTFSVFTFSKSYAMPGYRVGYLVVPSDMADRTVRAVLHSVYSVATGSQFGAVTALDTPTGVMRERRRLVREAWLCVQEMLEVRHTHVTGGLYTFLDLAGCRGGTRAFLDQCLLNGVSLAPGLAFGDHCTSRARLCFTAVPPDRLREGIERINKTWRRAAA